MENIAQNYLESLVGTAAEAIAGFCRETIEKDSEFHLRIVAATRAQVYQVENRPKLQLFDEKSRLLLAEIAESVDSPSKIVVEKILKNLRMASHSFQFGTEQTYVDDRDWKRKLEDVK